MLASKSEYKVSRVCGGRDAAVRRESVAFPDDVAMVRGRWGASVSMLAALAERTRGVAMVVIVVTCYCVERVDYGGYDAYERG